MRGEKVRAGKKSGEGRSVSDENPEFPREGEQEIRKLREADRKLNESRTLEFPLDPAGNVLRVRYQAAHPEAYDGTPSEKRRVHFSCTLPDTESEEWAFVRWLFGVAEDVRKNSLSTKDREFLANAVSHLASQLYSVKPDWDARAAFGLPIAQRGRPAHAGWRDLYLAIDVELGRALKESAEESAEETAAAWLQSYDVVEKAWKKWGKTTRKIVATWIAEDCRRGMKATDTVNDHRESLRLVWPARAPCYQVPIGSTEA